MPITLLSCEPQVPVSPDLGFNDVALQHCQAYHLNQLVYRYSGQTSLEKQDLPCMNVVMGALD